MKKPLTPEQKLKRNEYRRKWRTPERQAIEREKERARYAALTPERKAERAQKAKEWRELSMTAAYRFSFLKRSAVKRGYPVTISLEEYSEIIKHPCFYCRGELSQAEKKCGSGVDRVRNDLGYIPFNCVSCCWVCNRIKGDHLSSREALEAVEAIIQFRKRTSSGIMVENLKTGCPSASPL